MDKLKQWLALTMVACLAIVAAGWFLLVSPKRAEATALKDQTLAQDATNDATRAQLQVLQAQAKDLPKKQADLARVAAKIPDNPGLPSLIRALTVASTSAGVDFVSVQPGPPSPVVDEAAAAPSANPDGTIPVQPASSVGTLASIPIAINVVGDYFEVEQFVAELEELPRALRISNLSLTPGTSPTQAGEQTSAEDGSSLTTTISGSVFMASARPAAVPVTAPIGSGAPSGLPVPSGTPAPAGALVPSPLASATVAAN